MQPSRNSHRVRVGHLEMGGDNPVRVQSMTNTPTCEVARTVAQVLELAEAGSELVRFTVKDDQDALAVPEIVSELRRRGCSVPVVGDFHFNGHRLLASHPECARSLDKYRINPGNVGVGTQHDGNFRTMIELAIEHGKAVRIGVNGGSLDQGLLAALIQADLESDQPRGTRAVFLEAMVESALQSARRAEEYGLSADRLVLSAKVSQVDEVVAVYQSLAARSRYALHVGLTEAGMGLQGTVSSTLALGLLLARGIGDTIRVSLTPEPGQPRSREVEVAREILQSLGLRSFYPRVTSCPGCGRTSSTRFQELAREVQDFLRRRMPQWLADGATGVAGMKVAVMGCVVNGPGEAREAHIGVSLPGTGESPAAPVFADGRKIATLKGEDLAEQFEALVEDYVRTHYHPASGRPA